MGSLRSISPTSATIKLLLVLLLSASLPTARAWSFPTWLDISLPNRGSGSATDEIKCYSLPYGGLGFLSHCLTYWTLLMLGFSRSPWLIKPLKEWKTDCILGILSIIATLLTSALAIIRCRSTWPFVLIAVWKMLLGFSLGCCTIHRAFDVRRQLKGGEKEGSFVNYSPGPMLWLLFYGPAVVIGLVGLVAVVVDAWPDRTKAMEIIAGVFGASVLAVFVMFFLVGLCLDNWGDGLLVATVAAVSTIGVLAALFSDWILAAIEVKAGGSWVGLPSDDIAWLYWTYFAAKRLPLFSL